LKEAFFIVSSYPPPPPTALNWIARSKERKGPPREAAAP
jgi:hypothetical protein